VKVCTACGVAKPLDEFHRRSVAPDGRTQRCKPCGVHATVAARARHPETRRAWLEANRDRTNVQQAARRDPVARGVEFRAWCAANREAQVQRVLAWARANPERRRATQQRRIARQKRAAGVEHTTAAMIRLRAEMFGCRCRYCGGPYETIDHRIPLARGGSHWPANLVPACKSCNFGKGTKTEREFLSGRT